MFKNVQLNHGWLVEDQGQEVDEKCDDKDTKKKKKRKSKNWLLGTTERQVNAYKRWRNCVQ